MNSKEIYVEVVLPLPLKGTFTYRVPYQFNEIKIGQRVVVQFGIRKVYTAIVIEIHNQKPDNYKIKDIISIFNEDVLVSSEQLIFWKWISNYYMSNIGDVMNMSLPSSLKLTSESKLKIHSEFDGDLELITSKEMPIIELILEKNEIILQDLYDFFDYSVFSIINELIRKEIINVEEKLKDKYKIKTLLFVSLNKDIEYDIEYDILSNAPKQRDLIQFLKKQNQNFPKKKWSVLELLNKTNTSRSVINSLQKKNIINLNRRQVSRLMQSIDSYVELNSLNNDQKKALIQIKSSFAQKKVCLLHGVTSSGKTEIYIHLIQEHINNGNQVLYLLPEISLSTQIINRLRKHFGNKVGIYHSRMNNNERVEIYNAVKENDHNRFKYSIILGTRSSIFLPFKNLSLIIVDEEHDSSFKQTQKDPRYHARDASIYLSKLHNSNVLLGSATPSLESNYNVEVKKYEIVKLNNRFLDIDLPKIELVDIKKEYQKKRMKFHFSEKLIDSIAETLKNKKQVILFQNRRGFAPILECISCNWNPKCKDCDVSLTFHKQRNILICHYCGYFIDKISSCKLCNDSVIDKGFGTERIEEELNSLFPETKSIRMDYDTTRKKDSYQEIIDKFQSGEIDILIGTQMISKGLDFDNVQLVGVLGADNMLKYPDFRSNERAFQILSQVSGRAGRKNYRGKVIIQTFDTKHKTLNQVKNHAYDQMYLDQINERKLFKYPPFYKIISINIQHKQEKKLDLLSNQLSTILKSSFGDRVLGPQIPIISKIRRYYHQNILIKIEQGDSIHNAKSIINKIITICKKQGAFKSSRIILDVDPY